MKRGHIPVRTCIGCHQKRSQDELVRLERNSEGRIILNEKRGKGGRGFYLCPKLDCYFRAKKKSKLSQLLHEDSLYLSFKERLSLEGIRGGR